jgi:sarcosine oxidase subunit beta
MMDSAVPPRLDKLVDVAVVGAGITGLSIAWHLAHLGVRRVAVVERSGVGAGASGVQPGGVRQQWGTRVNCEMAIESLAFYRDVTERLQARARPVLEQCGYAFLAESEESLARLAANVELQNELGIPSRIATPAEVEELVPGLVGDTLAGAAWCGEDGYFDQPQGVVEAFAEAATRSGVELMIGTVESVSQDGEGWSLQLADGTAVRAGQVVVAAGADSVSIVRPLGLSLPIEKQRRYLFLSDPIRERLVEPLVIASERHFAAKQLANGRVLSSDLAAEGDVESGRAVWRRTVQQGVEAILPVLQFVSYPLLVEGDYDVTPDHQPILGAVDGLEGLWLAAGFSGHGFMMAPAIGRRLAAAITGEEPCHPSLVELSLARFGDQTDLTRELQIV